MEVKFASEVTKFPTVGLKFVDTARYVTLSLTKKNATYGNFGNLVTYFPVFPLKKCIIWVILAFW